MQRKVERKVIAAFCTPERLDHATVVAPALRSRPRRKRQNGTVRPACHARAFRERVEDEARGEAGLQERSVENDAWQRESEHGHRRHRACGQARSRLHEIDDEAHRRGRFRNDSP